MVSVWIHCLFKYIILVDFCGSQNFTLYVVQDESEMLSTVMYFTYTGIKLLFCIHVVYVVFLLWQKRPSPMSKSKL